MWDEEGELIKLNFHCVKFLFLKEIEYSIDRCTSGHTWSCEL